MFASALRQNIITFSIIGFIILISSRLFVMQVLENTRYQNKSEENSVKKRVIEAPRGIFFDRNFNVLVSNKPSYTLTVTPLSYDDSKGAMIEKLLDIRHGYIDEVLHSKRRFSKYMPRKIIRDIPFSVVVWLEENKSHLNGVEYTIEIERDHSYGVLGSHMFGYIKEISPEQLKSRKNYRQGDLIGFSGIEKEYEKYLKGTRGYRLILVDAKQKTIGNYLEGQNDLMPVKGNDLVLTVDAGLQKLAEKEMEGKSGAVVAIDPVNGEILAFVSSPSYNLSAFGTVTSSEIWNKLNNNEDKPLFNRASMAMYPPGSTLKMSEALIALEENIITPSYSVNCNGVYTFGNRPFKCTHVHGKTDLVESIEHSCNIYYYDLIQKIGLERWNSYMKKFGFGSKTGLDISEETTGLVPDAAYYDRAYGKNGWTNGVLINLGIGQGEILTTPVQLAQYTSLLATKGKTVRPHLVKGYIDSKTQDYIPLEFEKFSINFSEKNWDVVRHGMYQVVQGDGTAKYFRQKDFNIGGKTGTSQNPHGDEHALFVCFAPFEKPEIAVVVVVENVGYGSTHAAPVAVKLLKYYLGKTKGRENIAAGGN